MNPDLVYPVNLDNYHPPRPNDVEETSSGLLVSRGDQGVNITQLACAGTNPGGGWIAIDAFEDLEGFMERFHEWRQGDKPYFEYIAPKFGHHCLLDRNAIGWTVFVAPGFLPVEQTRAAILNPFVRQAMERELATIDA